MSRKKNSNKNLGITTEPRPAGPAGAGSQSAVSSATTSRSAGRPKTGTTVPSDRFWLEVVVVRMSHWLGSLQVAVILLSIFALVLAIGTMVESWYSDKVSKELVYRAWWFNLLLLLLGVNIFFAAAKKWPWKKYQTGFLITHVGLLTLVAGGLMTGLGGTDTTMALVATDDPQMQASIAREMDASVPQGSRNVSDRDIAVIRVQNASKKSDIQSFDFEPRSLAWGAGAHFHPQIDLPEILNFLAHPLPASFNQDLGGDARLEVLSYYPHVRKEEYRPAEPGEKRSFPAVKVLLTLPFPLEKPERWVAADGANNIDSVQGIGAVQMLDSCPAELLQEFTHPARDPGPKGQLVLYLDGETHRLAVDKLLDAPAESLGKSGWKARITGYEPSAVDQAGAQVAADPMVRFELTAPDGTTKQLVVLGRRSPGKAFPLEALMRGGEPGADAVPVWYHAADQRFGEEVRAVLQFATGPDGKLYYRSYNSHTGKFAFERYGEAPKSDDTYPFWGGMNAKFQVIEYLPEAMAETWFIPEDLRPGLENPRFKPAIHCRLHAGGESRDFWVGRTEKDLTHVTVGSQAFDVGFNDQITDLGFEIKLLRAEQTVDPGTQQPASYTSYVQLTDKARHLDAQDRVITMNQPLEHGGVKVAGLEFFGYKFYQSGLVPAGMNRSTLKPISVSIFTVSRDPGLLLKYIGSSMLALGIACMFYMKAYFFKPRGRKAPAGPALGNGQVAEEVRA